MKQREIRRAKARTPFSRNRRRAMWREMDTVLGDAPLSFHEAASIGASAWATLGKGKVTIRTGLPTVYWKSLQQAPLSPAYP